MANMLQAPIRLALVGHSYIRRLDDFMSDPARSATHGNLGLSPAQVDIQCFSRGGARVVPGFKDIRVQVNAALAAQCTIVVLHVGENDLNLHGPQVIAGNLQQIIQHILGFPQVRMICVGQLLVFPCHERHREAVVEINSTVHDVYAQFAGTPRVLCCKHRGMWFNHNNLFDPDQCHLNDMGLQKYWAIIRKWVKFAIKP